MDHFNTPPRRARHGACRQGEKVCFNALQSQSLTIGCDIWRASQVLQQEWIRKVKQPRCTGPNSPTEKTMSGYMTQWLDASQRSFLIFHPLGSPDILSFLWEIRFDSYFVSWNKGWITQRCSHSLVSSRIRKSWTLYSSLTLVTHS